MRDCHDAWKTLGRAHYDVLGSERGSLQFRRSLYVTAEVRQGERFTRENVRSIRPGLGLSPAHLDAVLGGVASRDITRGEPVAWEMLSEGSKGAAA